MQNYIMSCTYIIIYMCIYVGIGIIELKYITKYYYYYPCYNLYNIQCCFMFLSKITSVNLYPPPLHIASFITVEYSSWRIILHYYNEFKIKRVPCFTGSYDHCNIYFWTYIFIRQWCNYVHILRVYIMIRKKLEVSYDVGLK